ncbi:hypothetical protein DPMN_176951 [Dreissena polymorpha]|uniref:Uncharacterized protein n=1 Tax=Dreissena polymorpha TaxID=45954 RepID=A0A9D4ECC6_DREPO|nr:hypothetical protein DPMN_176951 [Dreissena polymorpha]
MSTRVVGMHTKITNMSAMQRLTRYIFTVVFIRRLHEITTTTRILPTTPTIKMMAYKIVELMTMYSGGVGISNLAELGPVRLFSNANNSDEKE